MADESGKRVNWTPDEWLRVTVNMLPLLKNGDTRYVALARAMRKVIAKPRQHDDAWIQKASTPASKYLNAYLEKANALSDNDRLALTKLTPAQAYALANPDAPKMKRKSPPPRVHLDEGRDYEGGARWTTLEKAKLARMVNWFQSHNAPGSLSRHIIEAQELVLDADRRRSIKGIQAAVGNGRNAKMIEEGTANLWLLKDIPFNPPLPPGAEQAQEASETAQIGVETSAEQPTTLPHVAAPAAPLPLTDTIRSNTSAAVARFGETMMAALDALLTSHTQSVLHSMETRLAAQSSAMASEVAALVEHGMRRAVHRMMEQELGGNVAPPVASPAAPQPVPEAPRRHNPEPAAAPRVQRLKVDIVGLNNGGDEQLIAQAFGGGEVDLRFTRPTDSATFQPSPMRHCIVMSERIPHAISYKLKSAKVTPLYVKATAGHIIHAIEELQRAQAAQVAH